MEPFPPISGSKHDTAQMVTHPWGWDYTVLSAKKWVTAFSVSGVSSRFLKAPLPDALRPSWSHHFMLCTSRLLARPWSTDHTKEDRSRSECNQEANVFGANFPPGCRVLGLRNSISPSTGAGDDPWRPCRGADHLQSYLQVDKKVWSPWRVTLPPDIITHMQRNKQCALERFIPTISE